MHIALIGPPHAFLRRLGRALRASGHTVHDTQHPDADHIIVDARALTEHADLANITGLVHHPTAQTQHLLCRLPRVIATSAPVGERLISEYGVARERLTVITPGVDDARRASGHAAGCRLLAVGALIPRKGHDVLLRALDRLFDLDWQLTIAGSAARDPAHAHALTELATRPNLAGRVCFTDPDDDALETLWQDSDAFALASHWEAYGMAAADALRRGLPVAVTAGGDAAALITPQAGVVCPPGDHDGLSKAIRRIIFDRRLRGEMSDAAWALGQNLPTWRVQAGRLLAILTG